MSLDDLYEKLQHIEAEIKKFGSPVVKDYYKKDEACEYLSCSPNTLTKLCITYNVYPVKLRGENYYKISDLRRMFEM